MNVENFVKALTHLQNQIGSLHALGGERDKADRDGDVRYDEERDRVVVACNGAWRELAWLEDARADAGSMSPVYIENGSLKMIEKDTGDVYNLRWMAPNDQGDMESWPLRIRKEKAGGQDAEDVGYWT